MISLLSRPNFATLVAMTKPNKDTRDFLLRGLPVEVADKLKVASSLHRKPMREYMIEVLTSHLKELERKGVTLTLPKEK
jgi:plasmid stability protein